MLKKIAKILLEATSKSGDIASRFGGEEFILLIVERTKDDLRQLGEKIRKKIEESPISFRRKKINFTVSLGAAFFPDDAGDTIELIDCVDQLLYQAKKKDFQTCRQ